MFIFWIRANSIKSLRRDGSTRDKITVAISGNPTLPGQKCHQTGTSNRPTSNLDIRNGAARAFVRARYRSLTSWSSMRRRYRVHIGIMVDIDTDYVYKEAWLSWGCFAKVHHERDFIVATL
jgi:hypothetical protein